jgi:hypothetical protein
LSAKLNILNDTEKAVVQTITMKLHTEQALSYLKDCGIKMARRSYFRYKKKVESMKWERLVHTANLFTEQHLQRLDKLELVEELMWKNYQQEKNPSKKVGILQAIVSMQPYLSNYYGATTFVLARRLKTDLIGFNKQEQENLREMTPLSGELPETIVKVNSRHTSDKILS